MPVTVAASPMHAYEIRSRKDRRSANLISDALPIRSAVVWRAKRNRGRNRLREVSQPVTRCCDSRLRRSGQRDLDARARGRFQRVLIIFGFGNDREG
jgi:hypothetical protein